MRNISKIQIIGIALFIGVIVLVLLILSVLQRRQLLIQTSASPTPLFPTSSPQSPLISPVPQIRTDQDIRTILTNERNTIDAYLQNSVLSKGNNQTVICSHDVIDFVQNKGGTTEVNIWAYCEVGTKESNTFKTAKTLSAPVNLTVGAFEDGFSIQSHTVGTSLALIKEKFLPKTVTMYSQQSVSPYLERIIILQKQVNEKK